ncbi:MAG: cbb3-type cytochrome c oxidase subunit 3 [candidate division Zixibacteria bacterium]|jgi:hypothetical protein|nr:cbb3-type cytochrome c oxidase subunit 3 [candidate division Zixibacteria bacterium]
MYKDVLQSIAGVEQYPVVALVLFLAAAVMIGIRVVRLRKEDIAFFSRLPLEDGTERTGDHTEQAGSK